MVYNFIIYSGVAFVLSFTFLKAVEFYVAANTPKDKLEKDIDAYAWRLLASSVLCIPAFQFILGA